MRTYILMQVDATAKDVTLIKNALRRVEKDLTAEGIGLNQYDYDPRKWPISEEEVGEVITTEPPDPQPLLHVYREFGAKYPYLT